MLQQTQVDRVLPKYAEWLDKFPSLAALASADETHVTETWRPLGYNIRPRRLQAIAREAVEKYDGRLPDDEATQSSGDPVWPIVDKSSMYEHPQEPSYQAPSYQAPPAPGSVPPPYGRRPSTPLPEKRVPASLIALVVVLVVIDVALLVWLLNR